MAAAPPVPVQGAPPKLVMGKQLLEGEEVKLKKPFAVMTLQKGDGGTRSYRAVGVVRSKLIFKNRPLPVARAEQATCRVASNKRPRADEAPTEA